MDIFSFFFQRSQPLTAPDPGHSSLPYFEVISDKTAEKILAFLSSHDKSHIKTSNDQSADDIRQSVSKAFSKYAQEILVSSKKFHNLFSLSDEKTEALDLKFWSYITACFPPHTHSGLTSLRREILTDILLACQASSQPYVFITKETLNGKMYQKMSLVK